MTGTELDILTPELVNSTFASCLAPVGQRKNVRKVHVGLTQARFVKAVVEEHRQAIGMMLGQLPTEFFPKKSEVGGGGWTLRNAYMTKDKVQWTTQMVEVERLLALGMAIGCVNLNTAMWPVTRPDLYVTIKELEK